MDGFFARLARQLGEPRGAAGKVVGRLLNRGNRPLVRAAVDAAGIEPGGTVADIGFGGGAALRLLLDGVGDAGVVHGVDLSATMLDQARRRHRAAIAAGRLQLHEATMDRLPLPDACLDAVVSTNTLYFVPDLAAAMAELARVIRGRLVLGIGDPEVMARAPYTKHGFRLRPVAEITGALAANGFTLADDRRLSDAAKSRVLVSRRS